MLRKSIMINIFICLCLIQLVYSNNVYLDRDPFSGHHNGRPPLPSPRQGNHGRGHHHHDRGRHHHNHDHGPPGHQKQQHENIPICIPEVIYIIVPCNNQTNDNNRMITSTTTATSSFDTSTISTPTTTTTTTVQP
uniref:Uncharacterized protein LOC113798017 n=1 Tax=Dermatophagoides pteronyssinus TaxID=6956 RepID=A0A6P6YHI0_DERPT|nr:uncharacterized protein LOC113798017 [Dermatophagoides pteronyssinus]